jgi:hypothetical protein
MCIFSCCNTRSEAIRFGVSIGNAEFSGERNLRVLKTDLFSYVLFHVEFKYVNRIAWAGIAQSVLRLATGWTVRGSNPGEGEIFRTCPDRPWCPPRLLYNGYRICPGGR